MSEAMPTFTDWDALREQGLAHFDPVQFHYLQALAQRARAHQGAARHLLDDKLGRQLAALTTRFLQAQPAHAADGPAQPASRPGRAALTALVRRLTQGPTADDLVAPGATRPELKALREHRNTWSKVSVGQELNQALRQAPKNAGPINSHMLTLRALEAMRDISPDYLNRFVSYVDTLLVLEQAERAKAAPARKRPSSSRPSSRRANA